MNSLDHSSLPTFEPLVREIHHWVFNGGIEALEESGHLRNRSQLMDVLKSDRSALRRFMRGCHYGFDKAQRQIGLLVIEYEQMARNLKRELKASRPAQVKTDILLIETLLYCLDQRQIILRRLADCLLHHLISREPWILRRTQVTDAMSPIDPQVLSETLATATSMNRANRLSFNVVTDLTTAVQVGDLIRLSLDSPESTGWEIIELKKGTMNDALRGLLGNQVHPALSPEQEAQIRENLGGTAVPQARRMLKQNFREHSIRRFREADHGTDPHTGELVTLRPDVIRVRDYWDLLRNACHKAKREEMADFEVSSCLRVIVISGDLFNRLGDLGVRHIFYHAQNPLAECALSSAHDKELAAMENIWPFFDLVMNNLHGQWPLPIFMWPMEGEVIFDLVFGRLRAFAQLDFDLLFELAKSKSVELDWLPPAKEEGFAKSSPVIPGSPRRNRAVTATMPSLSLGQQQQLLNGFFARCFLEFMIPEQLLELVVEQFASPVKMKGHS